MNKKVAILGSAIAAIVLGALLIVFRKEMLDNVVTIVGLLLINLAIFKFMNNIKYASTNTLRNLTIVEILIVIGLGVYTTYAGLDGKYEYVNYAIGAALYLTAISYLWQLNVRSNYTVRNRSFFGHIAMITLGSQLLLSEFDLSRLLWNLSIVLLVYGVVVVLYYIVKYYAKKK